MLLLLEQGSKWEYFQALSREGCDGDRIRIDRLP